MAETTERKPIASSLRNPEGDFASLPFDKRMATAIQLVSLHTGSISFHAQGLRQAREDLAEAMALLGDLLGEIETTVEDAFAPFQPDSEEEPDGLR